MRVYSIFSSINGEVCAPHQGSLCTFVRLAGCSVGCTYCDTAYSADLNSGKEMTAREILDAVLVFGNNNITITGGEPLEQMAELKELLRYLRSWSYNISIETSGEIPFNACELIPVSNTGTVNLVVDIKLDTKNHFHDYMKMWLTDKDFFKIVIGDEIDMIKAIHIKNELQHYGCQAKFAFSPCEGKITPKQLLLLLQEQDQTDAILNVQIHKLLNLTEDK